jgi:hypothetical protein
MKRSIWLIILFLLMTIVPFTGFAADDEDPDLGTIVINIMDQNGEDAVGSWYLHQGGINGTVPRNGSSSETFKVEEGAYYLEIRWTDYYKAYYLSGDNPKTLLPGGTTTFNVTYYPTQEDKEAALAEPVVEPEPDVSEPVVEPEPDVSEPVVEPESEAEPEVTVIPVYAPDFSTPPNVNSDVPDFSTPPAVSGQAANPYQEEWDIAGIQLAQTGPELFLLLIPSAFGGLYFATRKKKQ